MNYNRNEQRKDLNTLTLSEVAPKIKMADIDAVKRWLTKNNIEIHKIGKQNIVYELDVDCALNLPFARSLQRKHPTIWEEAYRNIINDDSVFVMVSLILKSESTTTPPSKVQPKNLQEEKLLNRLNK